ncbi:MAG: hypothetical protein WA580_04060 [Acidimicrobiales bacterium]
MIEVLLALVILSLASVALITAFGTDISASAEHRSLANFDTALASSISMTTTLIQEQYAGVFATCPTTPGSLAEYPSSAVMSSALNITGYTASISAVEYTDGSSFTTTCTNSTPGSPGDVGQPQLITIVVTDTATGYSQTNSVVVDDPTPVQVSGGSGLAANQLVFVSEPEGATVGSPFSTQPILEVQDQYGNIVTTDLSPITLTLSGGTNGAVLSSTCAGVETSGVVVYSGCSINEVGTGYWLTATEPSPTEPGQYLISRSTPFSVYSAQLDTPVITSVVPSVATAGALNITFTPPANAPTGQAYTVKACTDSAMSLNCTTPTSITPGSDLTGLVAGTSYYVQVTAPPSSNYLGATSPPFGPTMATVQLTAPGTPVLGYGTIAGSLSVTFTGSANAPPGETYTVKACTNTAMSSSCVSNTNFTPGAQLTGLTYVAGNLSSVYYVQVSANASPGYLAYTAAPPATVSHAVTSAVKTPTGFSAASSASQPGTITASFTETGGVGVTGPSSFTAVACTDSGMSLGCVTATNYTSGAQFGGLSPGTSYYVQITAVSSTTGFASAMTAVSSPVVATVQLAAPTNVTLGYTTSAGTLSVTFTPPNPAAVGQTYTLKYCTNAAMNANCVTNANYTGANLTGLTYTAGTAGTTYYVQITSNGSSGYLVSPASTQVSSPATSQVKTPTGLSVASSTSLAGAVTASFTEPAGGTAPSSFSATACTNMGMSANCTTVTNFTSAAQLSGLTQGTNYYVEITALGPTGYASATTAASSATLATVQLAAPTNVTLGYTTTAGTLSVTFTAPNPAATGQTYTLKYCTNMGMSANCVTNTNFTSGTNISPLLYVQGSPGTTYYVQVTANASTGYLVSPASSPVSSPATSQIGAPGNPTPTTSTTNGDIVVNFGLSTGTTPSSYTVTACRNATMTLNCVGPTTITPGAKMGGLTRGDSYWIQITAVGPPGYVDTKSAISTTSAVAG